MFSPTFPNTVLSKTKDVLPLHLEETFPPIIWIFNEGEGDEIESSLPFLNEFSTLISNIFLGFHGCLL